MNQLDTNQSELDIQNITHSDEAINAQTNQLEVEVENATQNSGDDVTQPMQIQAESEGSVDQNKKETENENNTSVDITLTRFTVEKMTGKRKGSEIVYSVEEEQFYKKKKRLSNGKVSTVCRNKGCNKRIYVDESTCTATYEGLYSKHEHSPHKAEYEKLKSLNRLKEVCANSDIVGSNDRKTSVIKAIFNAEMEK